MQPPRISIILPVKNAAAHLPKLIPALQKQQPAPPDEVLLLDSNSSDGTISIAENLLPTVRIVPERDFSHGGTRNRGAELAAGDILVFMTQDALPANDQWLKTLTAPFAEDKRVAASYSRQLPYPDARATERFNLLEDFPDGPREFRIRPDGRLISYRDTFLSNVSAAYRKTSLLTHPFEEGLIMGEDQQAARDFLLAGWAIVYEPQSLVLHSHRYTLRQTIQRYFDSTVANQQLSHPQLPPAGAADRWDRLRREARFVLQKHPAELPVFLMHTLAKTFGSTAGRFAQHLPPCILRQFSMHAYHWFRQESK